VPRYERRHRPRTQHTFLTDLLPTTLEITAADLPPGVKGISRTPIQGVSMAYTFDEAAAPSRHATQHRFLYGSGAIYHDGWKASFGHRPDFIDLFQTRPLPETAENFAGREVRELYDVESDPTEVDDVASTRPARLEEPNALFASEAEANRVYPLINWSDHFARFGASRATLMPLPPTSDPEVQRMMGAAEFEDVSISHDPAFGTSLPGETART
jgi:arylsulfatase A-like enzyme